jgi:hypothetical protein
MTKSDAIKNDAMWNEIDATGYANGDQFTSAEQVREYFTVENLSAIYSGGGAGQWDQRTLDQYADRVIENRRHCKL